MVKLSFLNQCCKCAFEGVVVKGAMRNFEEETMNKWSSSGYMKQHICARRHFFGSFLFEKTNKKTCTQFVQKIACEYCQKKLCGISYIER